MKLMLENLSADERAYVRFVPIADVEVANKSAKVIAAAYYSLSTILF